MAFKNFGSNSSTPIFLLNLLKNPNEDNFTKAQLVYLYYDHEFNLLENSSGSLAATEEGVLGSLLLEGLKPERDGFLYIFAINETSNPIEFDNLIVAHKTGTLLAVNHYYPFGLRWNGQGSPFQKYQFGGKEYEEELNLNTYDFHARQMDPVLSRFWGVDPMSSERVSFSPFNYVQNNPMNRVDPSGMLDFEGWHVTETGEVEYNSATTKDEFDKLKIKGDWIANEFSVNNPDGSKMDFFADGDQVFSNLKEVTVIGEKTASTSILEIGKDILGSQINDYVSVPTTIGASIANAFTAFYNDLGQNGSMAGNGGFYPKGTSFAPVKFNFDEGFHFGNAITRNNSPAQNKEIVLSTFGIMSNRFDLKIFPQNKFSNWATNQAYSTGLGFGLNTVIKTEK